MPTQPSWSRLPPSRCTWTRVLSSMLPMQLACHFRWGNTCILSPSGNRCVSCHHTHATHVVCQRVLSVNIQHFYYDLPLIGHHFISLAFIITSFFHNYLLKRPFITTIFFPWPFIITCFSFTSFYYDVLLFPVLLFLRLFLCSLFISHIFIMKSYYFTSLYFIRLYFTSFYLQVFSWSPFYFTFFVILFLYRDVVSFFVLLLWRPFILRPFLMIYF